MCVCVYMKSLYVCVYMCVCVYMKSLYVCIYVCMCIYEEFICVYIRGRPIVDFTDTDS